MEDCDGFQPHRSRATVTWPCRHRMKLGITIHEMSIFLGSSPDTGISDLAGAVSPCTLLLLMTLVNHWQAGGISLAALSDPGNARPPER
jgi:hypothetical protein